MGDKQIFLDAVKAANENNPILKKLTVEGISFIDYKELNNKVVDGIKVNSCIRLKTLPNSGFVGSRKIYYNKINLNDIYPNIQDFLILVSENADIKELLFELNSQTGIRIDSSFIVEDLDSKLTFDEQQCGTIKLTANTKSLYIGGSITIRYTSYKYRVLNYVKNRVISLSENIDCDGNTIIVPNTYYNDLSNFPPDHELYEKYNMLTNHVYLGWHSQFQNEILIEDTNGNMVPFPVRNFHYDNLPQFFDMLLLYPFAQKEFWENYQKYNVRRIIQGYLKYVTTDAWYLHEEDKKKNEYTDMYFVDSQSGMMTLDDFEFYYIGTTVGLLDKIKRDPNYDNVIGNAGINLNFKKCYALRWTSNPRNSRPNLKNLNITKHSILPFYWDLD